MKLLSRPDHGVLLVRLLERQRQMAENFIQFLVEKPISGLNDASRLPYPKDDLMQAFANQIANCPSEQVAEDFLSCMAKLSWFQEGVVGENVRPPVLDNTSAEKLSKGEFRAFASKVNEHTLLMRKQSEDTHTILRLYTEATAANPHLSAPKKGLWHRLTSTSPSPQGEPQPVLLGLAGRELEVLPLVAETSATPDIEDVEPFFEAEVGVYDVAAYRDILPLAVREGGKAIIKYPLVLAATDCYGDPVFFVTVELGEMFHTCSLCTFDGEGRHSNFGHWNLEEGSEAFLQRALTIATPHLKALRAS
jgi:hypothetical protein